ncbi:MAG TPA: FAD-binding oxidoreductase [Elusimicrobiota bacterium]|nr:FAD-binding oxidoreductase [Elusimicrobiota bacterium]
MTLTREGRAAVVSGIVEEAPGVRTFRLELSERAPFEHLPGQFVQLALPDEPDFRRAYSISSEPHPGGILEITASKVAHLTSRLFDLRGGETVLLWGPQGRWVYREEHRRSVLASAGTGVAPLRAMVRHVLAKGLPHKLSLLCGFHSEDSILYRQELAEFARRGVDVHVACGVPLDAPYLRARVPDLAEAACYFCGSNRLVDALRAGALEGGAEPDLIFSEKWGDY